VAVADDARAFVLLADYAVVDAAGKTNAIGAAFGWTGLGPNGLTPPQSVAAVIEVPAKYQGDTVNVSLELVDLTTASAVMLPSPSGKPEALLIQQDTLITRTPAGMLPLPQDFPARVNFVLSFASGLPLSSGNDYEWRLKINGYHRKGWGARFYVLPVVKDPVFGGPGGPADIPDVENPETLPDDLEPPPPAGNASS
jgi:hypothetical protein